MGVAAVDEVDCDGVSSREPDVSRHPDIAGATVSASSAAR
ncbi:Uncharacterised protein [Mycobacteroides abscessus subsp. abscessus]|nr:Uncharacterised protein [Mycobacteroides abscessus subsp. abscessus]